MQISPIITITILRYRSFISSSTFNEEEKFLVKTSAENVGIYFVSGKSVYE